MASPYDVLRTDPDASEEEIEQAYRERVKEAHPDQGGSTQEFQRVRAAYEELTTGQRQPRPDGIRERERERGPGRAYERDRATREAYEGNARVTYLNYEVLDDYGWSLDDENLFEKADRADLDHTDYGKFLAEPGESVLEAAENRGFAWPYACRGGACANCAVSLAAGEISLPVNHILPTELLERDIRLTCNGMPATGELKVVYNVKHLPDLEDLRLPPRPFEQAYFND